MQTWKRSLWSAALAFILAAPVVAQDGTDAPVETGDVKSASASSTELLATLQHVNKMEIEAGELAQQKGQSEGVKKYGETLEKDHKAAQEKIEEVADKLGVNLEQQEVDNDKDQKSIEKQHHAMDQLRTLEGAEFDAAFLKAMADGHKDVINRLESVQNEVSGDLKTLISDLLPNLRKHAQIAKELQSR